MNILLIMAVVAQVRAYPVSFVDCYDGDTCRVNMHLGMDIVLTDQVLRLCDIDAPEIRYLAEREAAIRARDWLIAQIKAATELIVHIPQKRNCNPAIGTSCDQRDKYGRWLAYIIADGVNLNKKIVDLQFANKYEVTCL